MTVAYLINQYPLASHSFIRREILALEKLGVNVARFSIRATGERIVDEADKAELPKTRAVLSVGAIGLLGATIKTLLTRPAAFIRSLRLAIKLGCGGDRGTLRHLIFLTEACVLLGWFAECGATHVHAHFGTNSTTVAMLCHELGGPPYSFTAHGPEEFDHPVELRLAEKIRRAKFVIGISDFARSQMLRWSRHEDWSKIHVVRCGVDGMFLDAGASAPSSKIRFTSVGRLAPQKGQLLLIEAAAKLAKEGKNFELVLVGDGPLRKPIEDLSHQLGLNGHLRITGMVSNSQVRQELLDSRAMVLPSFAEGLPVVVMESLALGRPVITTQIAGIPELVQAGVSGWLVPAGSVEALTDAMRQALESDSARLHEMGIAGAARVAQNHDAMKEAARLAALFGENSKQTPQNGRL